MDDTTHLKLPYILAAQSQKHVTHNEALRALDVLVQLAVADKDLAAPPGSPAEGVRYVVAASPTGAWAGHAGDIAAFQDGAWAFHDPEEGWLAWVADEDELYVFNGTTWIPNPAGGAAGVNPVSLVGVNATADSTDRLSVSSPASLFNHEGAGHQLKINKAAAGNTASVLFQTGFSGRAEFGLAGDDDFHVKVSADGSAWNEALVINRSNGLVRVTGARERLTANRTYYVKTTGDGGSDSADGLSLGTAFATLSKALATISALDIGTFTVTISVSDGTYTAGGTVVGPWLGSGTVQVVGNTGTPSNVTISATNANCFSVNTCGRLTLSGMRLQTTTAGQCIDIASFGTVTLGAGVEFGACAGSHIRCQYGGNLVAGANYAIVGGANRHFQISGSSSVNGGGRTVTLTGTPAFNVFAEASLSAAVQAGGMTFSGSATGKRYNVISNGSINTNAGGASFFPGDVAGTTSPDGEYN